MVLLTRKFKCLTKNLTERRGEASNQKGTELVCFEMKRRDTLKPIALSSTKKIQEEKEVMSTTWDEIDKSKSEEESRKEKESFSCFKTKSTR